MIRKFILVAGAAVGIMALAIWDTKKEVTRAVESAWRP